mmetsp:Transcript_783/g.1460  ORF Transcript_783/g.1460 Transcript_783/m.1460 type:complete len:95 (+) Transcript_783:46-330(+)
MKVVAAFLVFQASWHIALAYSECTNVEEPEYQGGDRQCFDYDEVGMVCGWDGTPDEAYCEVSDNGLLVCARKKGGGRCDPGTKPHTDKAHDREL